MDPPQKENPLFPLRLNNRWGEGVAEIANHASILDQLIGEDDRTSSSFSAAPTPT